MLAYLGPAGTYCSEAAEKYLRGQKQKIKPEPLNSISQIINSVSAGKYTYGIVPIENTIEGSVRTTLDKLVRKKLYIIAEVDIAIKHQLLTLHSVQSKKEIREITSHEQAIEQCRDFIEREYPSAKIITAKSTAGAVKNVLQKQLRCRAVIGSRAAAGRYGLQILQQNIADYKDNVTRFVVLAREIQYPARDAITSFVFSCKKDRPGGLYEMLGFLARDKINMTKIESRPGKGVIGDYVFFVDIDGNYALQAKVKAALDSIQKHSDFFKLLGVYQRRK
ncbi:MAG: prephenate dehydratase [Candidatus Margulisbacteria bacterium]|jgi:prephenate dehydratase|nr:prephenate dehydratase [Candidatus Margulisiibacteriota bacterium]